MAIEEVKMKYGNGQSEYLYCFECPCFVDGVCKSTGLPAVCCKLDLACERIKKCLCSKEGNDGR